MENKFRGTRPRVLSTSPDEPAEGRTFVWAWTDWFERVEGESGDIAFMPVASSEKELDEWLLEQGLERPTLVGGEYGDTVIREFLDEVPLYPESPELSVEEPFTEQNPEEDIEHG